VTERRRRGTGSIESYVDSKGRERFRARIVLESGERKPVGVYDTEEEAKRVLAAVLDETVDAKMAKLTGITVRAFGPGFLDKRETDGVRGITTERNRWKLLVDGSPQSDIPMAQFARRDAKAWLVWLQGRRIKYSKLKDHSRNGKKMSRVTMQNARNLFSKAFDVAVEDEICAANPFAGVKLPRDKGRTHEPWTYLNPEEQTKLLAAVPEPDRYMVAFAIGTGLRQGEQWSLRWRDVDLTKMEITVRFGSEGQPTKSGKIRRVPIFGLALDALQASVNHRGMGSLNSIVFPALRGDRRQKGEPDAWKSWVAAAGITRNVRWHDLRHTCASSLVAGWWGRRWDLYEVKLMLGHASITTTERYAHLADSALKLAARETIYKPDVIPLSVSKPHAELPPKGAE
jgi:integrase